MKRSLLILAAFTASAGSAMADGPSLSLWNNTNLTLWGMFDVGVSHTQGRGSALGRDASNNDRLGFRGVTDLGAGLSVTFALQHRFDPQTGTVENGNRPFWQGESRIGLLSKDYGWIRLGRGLTPVQDANGSVEPYGVATVGNLQDLLTAYYLSQEVTTAKFNPYGASTTPPGDNGRVDQGIFYDSPTIAGFHLGLNTQVGADASFPGGKVVRPFGAAVTYAGGPVTAFIGGERNNRDTRYFQMGATYDFGVAKVMASWARNDHPAAPVNDGVVVNGIAIPGANITGWGVGLHVPVGSAFKIRAGYGRATSDAPNAVAGRKFGIGGMYTFAKGTFVYSGIARGRALNVSTAVDQDRTAFDVGIHTEF